MNISDEQKKCLLKALETERDLLVSQHNQSPKEHDIVIEYIKNGRTDENPEKHELLDAFMNDTKSFLNDYGCK
jgi:hypothetical protein